MPPRGSDVASDASDAKIELDAPRVRVASAMNTLGWSSQLAAANISALGALVMRAADPGDEGLPHRQPPVPIVFAGRYRDTLDSAQNGAQSWDIAFRDLKASPEFKEYVGNLNGPPRG